jgi:N-acetylglucosaminyldiphosphoundecaprenol N-acetyl-beta-D-mannosaminyltransferase
MSINVIGMPLFDGSLRSAGEDVITKCLEGGNGSNLLISATGAHGIVYAKRNPEFMQVLHGFYLNLPDGVPGSWIGRLKGARQMERCYGPDFFAEVMRLSASEPVRHFLCGGKEGVAEDLRRVCAERFNNHNCVGGFSPSFRQMTDDEMMSLAEMIMASHADIVWIGMSTPKQELFAARLAKFVHVRFIITIGAAFDFHTGRLRQAPDWMQGAGLEWFFRLLMEPRRLFPRYIEIVPLFVYYAAVDLWKFWWRKRNKTA